MTEENPLETLYVDKDEINKERLTNALKGKIGMDRETGDPYFMGEYGKLSNKQKIIAYLLYRKALVSLKKITEDDEGVSSKMISEDTGSKYQTVRGWLAKMDYVENDKKRGGYYVPNYAMEEAIEVIEDE